jgi:hypothetical protein
MLASSFLFKTTTSVSLPKVGRVEVFPGTFATPAGLTIGLVSE